MERSRRHLRRRRYPSPSGFVAALVGALISVAIGVLLPPPASAAVVAEVADWAGTYTDSGCTTTSSVPLGSNLYLQSRACRFTAAANGGANPTTSYCREEAGAFVGPVGASTAVYGCTANLDAYSQPYGLNIQVIVNTGEVGRPLTCLGGTGTGSFTYVPPPSSGGVTVNIFASLAMDSVGLVTVTGSVVNLNGIAVGPLQARVSTSLCQVASVTPAWTGTLTV